MALSDMTAEQFMLAAARVLAQFPHATLVKNEVGNLAIISGGQFVGYVDLRTGELDVFAEPEDAAG